PSRCTEPRQQLNGTPALAHDEVAQGPTSGATNVWLEALRARPRDDGGPCRVGPRRCQQAAPRVDDLGPASAAVEAEHELAVALAERVLELVAVAPGLRGGHDWLLGVTACSAEALQRRGHLALLL